MKNKLIRWYPIKDWIGTLDFLSLSCNPDAGLIIHAKDEEGEIVSFEFDNYLAYYNTNESYCFDRAADPNKPYHSLFTVECSIVKQFFLDDNITESIPESAITHYAIYTSEDCIDILSCFEPVVKWL